MAELLSDRSMCPMCHSLRTPEADDIDDGIKPCPDCGTYHADQDRHVNVEQLRGAVDILDAIRAEAARALTARTPVAPGYLVGLIDTYRGQR